MAAISVRIPGNNGRLEMTDNSANSSTADIEIIVRMKMDVWSQASCVFFEKDNYPSAGRSWQLSTNSFATLLLYTWDSAGNETLRVHGTTPTFSVLTNSTYYWIRTTLDADNGAGSSVWTVQYATDQATVPTSWTTIGSTVSAAVMTIWDSTAPLDLGSNGGNDGINANIKYFSFSPTIGGTPTVVFDAANVPATTTTSPATSGQVGGTWALTSTAVWEVGTDPIPPRPSGIFRYPYEFSSLDPKDQSDFVTKIMDRDRALEDYVSEAGVGITSHSTLTNVLADQHHAKEHIHSGDGSGSVTHAATTGQTANDHHNQAHTLTGTDHTASGLTSGHVMRATGATTFAFGALQDADVPATIARDSEVTTAVSDHSAAADPHAGYVLESLLDAKGDLYVATADDTVTRLAVGSNDQVLTADSAQATGVKWATPSSSSSSTDYVPYYLGTGETFTLPVYKQALYHELIQLDGGTLDVAGLLIQINDPPDMSALFHMQTSL